jgi:hypothetical protein
VQVIDAVTVVGVVVRPEDRVDLVDADRQQLLTQVGRGIDQQARSGLALDQDGDARAAIPRLGGIAQPPVVADARHSG